MTRLLHQSETSTSRMTVEDGKLYVQTVVEDDHVLSNNQAHRNAGTLRQGSEIPLQPKGNGLIYHFQIEPQVWALFCKKNKALIRALSSHDQVAREKAAASIAARHPEWVSSSPRVFAAMGAPSRA
jgi:hypothetical protein